MARVLFERVHQFAESVEEYTANESIRMYRKYSMRNPTQRTFSDLEEVIPEQKPKGNKRISMSEKVAPPLDSSPLSFFDDFHSISGIPAFILDQNEVKVAGDPAPSTPILKPNSGTEWSPKDNLVTVCSFSTDTTRLVSGHVNGNIRFWDAEHGHLLAQMSGIHNSAVGCAEFWDDEIDSVVSVSVDGVFHQWQVGKTISAGYNLDGEPTGGSVAKYALSHSGTALICSKCHQESWVLSVKIYNISDYDRSQSQIRDFFECGRVYGYLVHSIDLDVALSNGVLSCIKLSPKKSSILLGTACTSNDRARGVSYVIQGLGADVPENPRELVGEMGEWSPRGDLVVTWDQVHSLEDKRDDPASPAWVWNTNVKDGEAAELLDPDFGHILWCKFVCRDNEGCHKPFLATCVFAEYKNVCIVLWTSYYATATSSELSWVPVHTMSSSIEAAIGTFPMVSGALSRRRWSGDVSVRGSHCIAATEDGRWLGAVSSRGKTAVVWDPSHGVLVLKMDLSAPEIKMGGNGKINGHCDLVFPKKSEARFAIVWDSTIVILNPRVPSINGAIGSPVLGLKYKDPRLDAGGQPPICKFSSDSNVIGLLHRGSNVLNVWSLSGGIRHTLAAGDIHMAFTDFALIHKGQGRIQVATVSTDRSVLLWKMACQEKPVEKVLYTLSNTNFNASRGITFVVDCPYLVVCERETRHSKAKLVYIPLDGGPNVGDVFCRPRGSDRNSSAFIWPFTILGMARSDTEHTVDTNAISSDIPALDYEVSAAYGCWFSSDGYTAILREAYNKLVVWDVRERAQSGDPICYKFNLDKLGHTFPHHISDKGDFAVVLTARKDAPLVCTPDTEFADLPALVEPGECNFELSEGTSTRPSEYWVAISTVDRESCNSRTGCLTKHIHIVDLNGRAKTKVLRGPKLNASDVLVISPDGRRVACLADWRKLRVWSAHACDGLLPDYYSLKDEDKSEDLDVIRKLLSHHGPAMLNLRCCSFVIQAISDLNMLALGALMNWARRRDLKVRLRQFGDIFPLVGIDNNCKHFPDSENCNALDLAMKRRSSESVVQILNAILRGQVPGFEKAKILEESLVKVGELYPEVLYRSLQKPGIFIDVCTLEVKESVFGTRGFQVTIDPRLTAPKSVMQEHWDQATTRAEGVKVPAALNSIPYADAAHMRGQGLVKRLLMAKVPKGTFSSLPLRMVLFYKWHQYGEMKTIAKFIHFFILLVCFTTYSILLGSTSSNLSEVADDDGISVSHNYSSHVFLSVSALLAFISLIHELRQILAQISEDGFQGFIHYISSMWNWVEMTSYCLLAIAIPVCHGVHNIALSILVAATSIMLWWKMMYFAKTYRKTGPLVIVLEKILNDIFYFLILGFMVVFGFGVAFHVLYRHIRSVDPADEDFKDTFLAFGSVGRTMMTMLTYMLGEFDLAPLYQLNFLPNGGGKALRDTAFAVFILYVFSISVLLLNLLIAIMADSFQRMKCTEEPEFYHGRALTIDDLESMMSEKKKRKIFRRTKDKGPEYIHILTPLSNMKNETPEHDDRNLSSGMEGTLLIESRDVAKMKSPFELPTAPPFSIGHQKGQQHSALLPDMSLIVDEDLVESSTVPNAPPQSALDEYYKKYFERTAEHEDEDDI